jgi:hypothetical protein
MPRVLYHGTWAGYYNSVIEKGLVPGREEEANDPEYGTSVEGNIFFAEREQSAVYFSMIAAEKHEFLGKGVQQMIVAIDTARARVSPYGVYFIPTLALDQMKGREWITRDTVQPGAIAFIKFRLFRRPKGAGEFKSEEEFTLYPPFQPREFVPL